MLLPAVAAAVVSVVLSLHLICVGGIIERPAKQEENVTHDAEVTFVQCTRIQKL